LDGYDSRGNVGWTNAYANVQAGFPGLFRNKTIRMLSNGNFQSGDEVFIRFRLFSDPFAVGWGWAIDDLEIQNQSINTNTLDESYFSSINIFPNPALKEEAPLIRIQFKEAYSGMLTIVNGEGRLIERELIRNQNQLNKQFNTSSHTSAVYYLSLYNEDGTFSKRFVVQ